MKKRPIIGVVGSQVAHNEQKQLLNGIIFQAQKLNMDTVIISNVYNGSRFEPSMVAENQIYELVSANVLDGLILTPMVYEPEMKERVFSELENVNVPIVAAGVDDGAIDSVNIDIVKDFEKLTDHFVDVHGYTDIAILTGPASVETSEERVNGYRASLEKHGIPFDLNKVYYGDFWVYSGEKLAKKYISGELKMPQAVICTNEFMAFGLIDTLMENGINIPEKMAVAGYEHVNERIFHVPILTTCLRSRFELGVAAVKMLYRKITGEITEETEVTEDFSGKIITGDSCSCGVETKALISELAFFRNERYYSMMNLWGLFEERLTECRSVENYCAVLAGFTYLIHDVKKMYLCLRDSWCESESKDMNKSSLMMCYPVYGCDSGREKFEFFQRSQIFPDYVPEPDDPSVFYLCPLYFGDRIFGYIILQYEGPNGYDDAFRNWLKSASQALEFLRMKNDVKLLMEYQDMSVFYDSTTGLCNKTGFRNNLEYVSEKGANKKILILLLKTRVFTQKVDFEATADKVKDAELTADVIRHLSGGDSAICGTLEPDLYIFAIPGDGYDDSTAQFLEDKAKTLMLRKDPYINNNGIDSFLCSCICVEASNFDYNRTLDVLNERISAQLRNLADKRSLPNYGDFAALRCKLYLDPIEPPDIDIACRSFRCSTGHFRRLYKERFDISYHQDIITSKIYLAKYMLLTTRLDITAIAEKCGYEDYKYFLRQFQQTSGTTPSHYRNIFF